MKTFKQFKNESLSEASKPIASFDGDYGARADVHTDPNHGHVVRLYKDGKPLDDKNLEYFHRKKEAIEHAKREVGINEEKDQEGATVKNSLHTILRTASALEKSLKDDDQFPEWVSEKMGSIKDMMVSVMDHVMSSREQDADTDLEEGASSELMLKHFMRDGKAKAIGNALTAKTEKDKEKAEKSLSLIKSLQNKRDLLKLTTESVSDLEAAKFELTHHVTNTIPSSKNIIKMHDWIHHIHKLGGSSDHEYEKIANNPLVPQPYRTAASV